jgi:hypothetical protein
MSGDAGSAGMTTKGLGMAKAVKTSKEVVTVTETVTLTLSIREAEFLATVMLKIGGSETNSPRKHQAAIAEALARAQISAGMFTAARHAYALMTGAGINFETFPATWTESDRG